MSEASGRQKPVKWRKILYEDQGVPDNYVDETFLHELRKNLHTRTYDFWTVVKASGVVTQQLCSVCLFIVAFLHMDADQLSPQILFMVGTSIVLIGYCLYDIIDAGESRLKDGRTRWDDIKTGVMLTAFGGGLSPILMTLTKTISTDTIYAMTSFMLLANMLFHDYGANAALVSQTVSFNAAIFASVCLASRLPTVWHAFSTVSLAVYLFALWPSMRRKIKSNTKHGQVIMTVLTSTFTVVALTTVSMVATILFSMGHLFITFVCPAWLLAMQPYKNNIYGPWDEAIVEDLDKEMKIS